MTRFFFPALALTLWGLASCSPQPSSDPATSALQIEDAEALQRFENQTKLLQENRWLPPNNKPRPVLVQNPAQPALADTSSRLRYVDSLPNPNPEHASMLMGVRSHADARAKLSEAARIHRAEILHEEERRSDLRLEGTVILRLAPDQLHPMIEQARALATILREKRVWKDPLATRFAEVQGRLRAKQTAQTRLQELMRNAKNLNEVLPIQRELDQVQEDMAAIQLNAQSIRQSASASTLAITYYQEVQPEAPAQAGFGERMSANLSGGWSNFKEFLVVAAGYWVYAALGLVFLGAFWMARRKARRQERLFQQQLFQQQQQWLNQQKR